jgi:hypothetical protein
LSGGQRDSDAARGLPSPAYTVDHDTSWQEIDHAAVPLHDVLAASALDVDERLAAAPHQYGVHGNDVRFRTP